MHSKVKQPKATGGFFLSSFVICSHCVALCEAARAGAVFVVVVAVVVAVVAVVVVVVAAAAVLLLL